MFEKSRFLLKTDPNNPTAQADFFHFKEKDLYDSVKDKNHLLRM